MAGNAQAEANAVFVGESKSDGSIVNNAHAIQTDPFNGVDLATVGADAATVESMRKLAEAAETDQLNPAIAAATGADATALQNGKIKNKVLKLTGETQAIKIKVRSSHPLDTRPVLMSLTSASSQLRKLLGMTRLTLKQSLPQSSTYHPPSCSFPV